MIKMKIISMIILAVFVVGLAGCGTTPSIINPEMVKRGGERELMEACLSVPGYAGEIKRSVSVTVKGLDRRGKAIRIKASDLMAEALEHELDHLNGILYIDHVAGEDYLYKTSTDTRHGPGSI